MQSKEDKGLFKSIAEDPEEITSKQISIGKQDIHDLADYHSRMKQLMKDYSLAASGRKQMAEDILGMIANIEIFLELFKQNLKREKQKYTPSYDFKSSSTVLKTLLLLANHFSNGESYAIKECYIYDPNGFIKGYDIHILAPQEVLDQLDNTHEYTKHYIEEFIKREVLGGESIAFYDESTGGFPRITEWFYPAAASNKMFFAESHDRSVRAFIYEDDALGKACDNLAAFTDINGFDIEGISPETIKKEAIKATDSTQHLLRPVSKNNEDKD